MVNIDMPSFSTKSEAKLLTCDHRLQRLFREVVKSVDCTILCGHRGKEEQDEAYALGNSTLQWPHSNHNVTPSRAVDVAPYPVDWNDLSRFREFAVIVKEVAARMGIKVRWGGDWKMRDYPHWEVVD